MTDFSEYNLVFQLDSDGNETGYYTREPDGVSGMTVTALAKFCGATQPAVTSLLNRIEESDPITNDLSEPLKPFVGKDLRLITNDPQGRRLIVDEACYAIAKYYADYARDYLGKPVAKSNLSAIGNASMRVFIWLQTGYIPQLLREQLRLHTTVYIRRLENMADHDIADHLWCTFREGAEVLLMVEKKFRVPVDQLDLCDGSIGSHWSKYRKGQPWQQPSGQYKHHFRDHRPDAHPNAFEYSELPYFRGWLREIYVPQHLPKYLVDRYGKRAVCQIYEENNQLNDYIIDLTKEKKITSKQNGLYDAFCFARELMDSGRLMSAQSM